MSRPTSNFQPLGGGDQPSVPSGAVDEDVLNRFNNIDELLLEDDQESIEEVPQPPQLPETVETIVASNGSKIYVVGTAHYSEQSQNDVVKTISLTQPDIVMVELCPSRSHILSLDKDTLLAEASTISISKIQAACKQNGLFNGIMYIMLLKTNASITKQLNMAPGGEFRVAYNEALKLPHCIFHLGDRPLRITLQRAMNSLTWWQTFKLAYHLLFQEPSISKEEVEGYKNQDFLEKMLNDLTVEYPNMGRVFLNERDKYLAHSLQVAASMQKEDELGNCRPVNIVGVVGIGHVSGIRQNFGSVTAAEIQEISRIPNPSISTVIVRYGIKFGFIGVVCYTGYKILPKSWTSFVVNLPMQIYDSVIST